VTLLPPPPRSETRAPDVSDLDRPLSLAARIASLSIPPLALTALVLVVAALQGWAVATAILGAFVLYLGIGATIVFVPAFTGPTSAHFDTATLVALACFYAVTTSFFWSYNLDLLERIPGLGPRLARIHDAAAATLHDHAWIRRWATLGVALFVVSPLPASGSIGGSVVGRLVGLSRFSCFLAVAGASVFVVVVYAAFGGAVKALLEARGVPLPLRIALALAALAAVVLVVRWLVRLGTRPGAPSPDASEGAK
jgi:putative small multi-drug export protein